MISHRQPSNPGCKVLFAALNSSSDLQHALAMQERGWLGKVFIPFGIAEDSNLLKLAKQFDAVAGAKIAPELGRRVVSGIPAALIKTYPTRDIIRTFLSRHRWGAGLAHNMLFGATKAFARHVAKHVGKYDVAYAFSSGALEIFEEAKKRDLFCVYVVRAMDSRFNARIAIEQYAKFPFLAVGANIRAIEKNAMETAQRRDAEWRLADLVLVYSEECLKSFEGRGLDLKKARVIPLAFPEPSSSVEEPGDAERPLRILWAGNFSVPKGAHCFIEALRQIDTQKTRLNIKVFGTQLLPMDLLKRTYHPMQLSPTIPRSQLFAEYRAADVTILPTLSDSFAMTIVEAMSQGCPVITTSQAGAVRFIKHQENGFVIPPADVGALADAIRWCSENRTALQRMRGKAKATAMTWQWNDFRKSVADVFAAALADRTQERES